MIPLIIVVTIIAVFSAWKLFSRSAYETASYTVIESESPFEVRDYPDLMMATTNSDFQSQGRDGSFMRLFRYISGNNEPAQKIAMTTPVFMEPDANNEQSQMGFVVPESVVKNGIPAPSGENVTIRQRHGGKFAVIRFAGELNEATRTGNEKRLREWMKTKKLTGAEIAESAGYDAPFTPGFLRRNEVLIRLK